MTDTKHIFKLVADYLNLLQDEDPEHELLRFGALLGSGTLAHDIEAEFDKRFVHVEGEPHPWDNFRIALEKALGLEHAEVVSDFGNISVTVETAESLHSE